MPNLFSKNTNKPKVGDCTQPYSQPAPPPSSDLSRGRKRMWKSSVLNVEQIRHAVSRDQTGSEFGKAAAAICTFGMRAKSAIQKALAAFRSTKIRQLPFYVIQWFKNYPQQAKLLVCLTFVLLSMAVTPAILGAIGFGTGGVVAGSVAAAIQAGIGNVAAGSLFAILTSAGMGGFGVSIVLGAVGGITAAASVAAMALWSWWNSRHGGDENGNGIRGNNGHDDNGGDDNVLPCGNNTLEED